MCSLAQILLSLLTCYSVIIFSSVLHRFFCVPKRSAKFNSPHSKYPTYNLIPHIQFNNNAYTHLAASLVKSR